MRGGVNDHAILRWLPALVWMALIFFVSSRSNPPSPDDPTLDFVWKKGVHVASYALLAQLYRYALGPSPNQARRALWLTLLYAISDEVHQSFVPERTARVTDVLIDMAGAALGLYGGRLWSRVTGGTARSSHGHRDRADDEPSA